MRYYWQFLDHGDTSYSLDIDSIPRSLAVEGCPKNGKYRKLKLIEYSIRYPIYYDFNTCSCENHCGWDMCNIVHPPQECLLNSSSSWYWDYRKNTWVAQVILGTNIIAKLFLFGLNSLLMMGSYFSIFGHILQSRIIYMMVAKRAVLVIMGNLALVSINVQTAVPLQSVYNV